MLLYWRILKDAQMPNKFTCPHKSPKLRTYYLIHLPSLGLPFVSSFEETRKWRKWRDQWPALSHAGSPLSSQSLTLPETPRPQLWKCSDSKWQNPSMKGLCMAVVMILKMSVWKLAVSVMPHSSIWYDSHPRKLQTPFPNFFWEFIRPP